MAKIMVIQHVPYEPLGTLDPLIRAQKHRIRYVNFARHPDADPDITGYSALIILGGPMNVDEPEQYPFLATEIRIIRSALKKGIPILGICLGAQLIAAALGAAVYPASGKELGWFDIQVTEAGKSDPLMSHWQPQEKIFQWHGHTFDLPDGVTHLACGEQCSNQAFRYGKNVYGLQFHLEITQELIDRWCHLQIYLDDIDSDPKLHIENIRADSERYIQNSRQLSERVFLAFLDLIPKVERHVVFKSR